MWIAFNFVSLQCETQLRRGLSNFNYCCELLSILYLCSVKHNKYSIHKKITKVVNCFQFCIFAVWNTTTDGKTPLRYSCELLSILYLCSVKHNNTLGTTKSTSVVNCFQFCIFAVWNTTADRHIRASLWLWIAFNFVSLQCETQRSSNSRRGKRCCELLSILYLCSVKHNLVECFRQNTQLWIAFNFVSLQCETQQITKISIQTIVVNCFQFCIFAVWNTTGYMLLPEYAELWIAFNFVSLQCETQPLTLFTVIHKSCELLSILYLCSVKHND